MTAIVINTVLMYSKVENGLRGEAVYRATLLKTEELAMLSENRYEIRRKIHVPHM